MHNTAKQTKPQRVFAPLRRCPRFSLTHHGFPGIGVSHRLHHRALRDVASTGRKELRGFIVCSF
jgi:hypothetical protein